MSDCNVIGPDEDCETIKRYVGLLKGMRHHGQLVVNFNHGVPGTLEVHSYSKIREAKVCVIHDKHCEGCEKNAGADNTLER